MKKGIILILIWFLLGIVSIELDIARSLGATEPGLYAYSINSATLPREPTLLNNKQVTGSWNVEAGQGNDDKM